MKTNFLTKILLAGSATLLFTITGCKKPDEVNPNIAPVFGSKGFYVINEGAYGHSNASISFYNKDSSTLYNDIYKAKNGTDLGDQAQSMTIFNGKGYICVQNSKKIEVVDIATFTKLSAINTSGAVVSPRYFLGVNDNTGYISDWQSNGLLVINLSQNTISTTIATGSGADKMLKTGDKVFVNNKGNFDANYTFVDDNRVTVINTSDNTVAAQITVGYGPSGIVQDVDGKIWVLCNGKKKYNSDFSIDLSQSTAPSIHKINPSTNEVETTITFNEADASADNLCMNGTRNKLFFNYKGNVYEMDITATSAPSAPLIARNFYGLAIDPVNDYIMGCDAKDFSSAGKVVRYIMHTNTHAAAVDSFTVGIAPNGVVFR